jgi:RHS repeat-associated protein
MKRIPSVARGRHLLVIAGLALASTVGSLLAADTYYVSDHLATTTAVADTAGEIASLEADAFGSPVSGGEQAARYTGKPYDADIGAYMFPFRNYRSDEARWMSADPSGFPDGQNANVYAPSINNGIDSLGLFTLSFSGTNPPASQYFSSGGNNYALTARTLNHIDGISPTVLGILSALFPTESEGWHFSAAGSRSGTVTVSDYSASHDNSRAGVGLSASYSGVASGAPSSSSIEGYTWIQLYQQNGGPYVVDLVNGPVGTPFYNSGYSTGTSVSFYDAPSNALSGITPTSSVNVGFLTFLVDYTDILHGTVNIYDGFTWGYNLHRE